MPKWVDSVFEIYKAQEDFAFVLICFFVNYGVQVEYLFFRTVIWEKANLTFAQYVVFTEEMYESAVNDNAEDFPKVDVDAYPMVVIGVKFVSSFKDWGDQSLVPDIGEIDRAKDYVKEFNYSQFEVVGCIFYYFTEDTINTTGLFGLQGFYFVL